MTIPSMKKFQIHLKHDRREEALEVTSTTAYHLHQMAYYWPPPQLSMLLAQLSLLPLLRQSYVEQPPFHQSATLSPLLAPLLGIQEKGSQLAIPPFYPTRYIQAVNCCKPC
jgi:hypothetical protein